MLMFEEEMPNREERNLYQIINDGLAKIAEDLERAELTSHEEMVGKLFLEAALEMAEDAKRQSEKRGR